MEILAVLRAIKEVLESVLDIYNAAQIVNGFFNDPDEVNRTRFEEEMMALAITRSDLLDASDAIRDAIAQVSDQIFRDDMNTSLTDMDTAEQDLATARRTANTDLQDEALTLSRQALNWLLNEVSSKNYPAEAVVITLSQILLRHLMISREADPKFAKDSVNRLPVENAISLLRAAAGQMEAAILAANEIHSATKTTRRRVRVPPEDGGGWDTVITWTFSVHYANVSGSTVYDSSTVYDNSTVTEDDPDDNPDFIAAKNALLAQAEAARSRGLPEDLANAGISELRGTADQAEEALRISETLPLREFILHRDLTYLEKAHYLIARRTQEPTQAMMSVIARFAGPQDFVSGNTSRARNMASNLLNTVATDEQVDALVQFGKNFGEKRAALAMLAAA